MATVTLTGKVKLPDGSIPTGALVFTARAKAEGAAGAVKARIPGNATIGTDGAVSAVLEAEGLYDVEAVLTGRAPARYSLGCWTAPAASEYTAPSLFDAWKTTLAEPDASLILAANFVPGTLNKTPKRGALDVWTFNGGSATYGANGVRIVDGTNLQIPPADNLRTAAGTIALALAPDGWGAGASARHGFIGGQGNTTNKLLCHYHQGNYLEFGIYDAAAAYKRAVVSTVTAFADGVVVRIGMRWNAGTLKLRCNSLDQDVQDGAGTGILGAINSSLYVGVDAVNATDEANAYIRAVRIWDRDLSDSELTAALAAL